MAADFTVDICQHISPSLFRDACSALILESGNHGYDITSPLPNESSFEPHLDNVENINTSLLKSVAESRPPP